MSRYNTHTPLVLLPENIFLLIAISFGVLFTFLLPPLAGSDEYFHYQRIATIAYGHWLNEDAAVPSGIVSFLKKTLDYSTDETLLPYSSAHYYDLASVALDADTIGILHPNYCTIHNAANYIPQVIAFRIGLFFNCTPLMLLYISRLTALLASVLITYHAIRIMPSWKYALCALSLLPPLMFYRVCLSTDAIADALGILLAACILKEIARSGIIKRAPLIRIVTLALLIGLCKLPYITVTWLFFAIPARRFASPKSRLLWAALTLLPGAVAGFAWMEVSRTGIFVGLHYETWGGKAFPDGQVAYILHNPLGFMGVLTHTLFSVSFFVDMVKEAFGHYGTMAQISTAYYIIMGILLCFVIGLDGTAVRTSYSLKTKLMAVPVLCGFMLLALTALYIHWTGLQAPVVIGFQGRYLYPLLPLFLMILPLRGRPRPAMSSAFAVGMFALTGLAMTVPVLMHHWQ